MVGWSDIPADLSDTAALERLDTYVPQDALVISSDLRRASATADAIQNHRTRLPHDPALREIHFGDWELKRFKDVEKSDPKTIRAFWETPGDVAPPNGESWHTISARVNTAIDHLVAAHTGRNIMVVAHFGAILTQIQRAKNLSNYETFSHKINNLSVTVIDVTLPKWTAKIINHNP